jgi:hypothetical protein
MAKQSGDYVSVGLGSTATRNRNVSLSVIYNNGSTQGSNLTFVERRRIKNGSQGTVGAKGWRSPLSYTSVAALRTCKPVSIFNEKVIPYPPLRRSKVSGLSQPGATSSYGYTPADSEFFDNLGVPNVSQNLIHEAETKALAKIQGAKYNLGATLAEAKRTAEEIGGLVTQLVHIILDVFRGRWKNLAKRFGKMVGPQKGAQTLASAWLMYQFGIKPIVNDVEGMLASWNDLALKGDMLIHVEATAKAKELPIPWLVKPARYKWARWDGTCERSARVILWASVDDVALATYSRYGLNPATMLWEALSFSWLIDYVLSIGNFLGALGSSLGLNFRSGTLSKRVYANIRYTVMPSDPDGNTSWTGAGCETGYKCLALRRTVYPTWPIPWVSIRNPIKSGPKVANLLALLVAQPLTRERSMGPLTMVGNYVK